MTGRRKISDSGESSKSAEKRAKKQREATIAAVLNEERGAGVRISDENSNSSLNESPITEEASNDNTRTVEESSKNTQKKNRKPRGPNKISQDDRGKAIEVNFNERDQPIGKESIKLATYLGALVRENVPVTLEHWSKLPNSVEETLWACIRQKFKLAESQRKMIIQKMGKHLRDYKSLLTKLIRDLSQGDDAPTELAIAKPRNLTSNEWATFIKGRLSSEFNGRSKIFKEMRKKQYLPHTMSRKGYARLEDDMRKKAAANGDKEVTRTDVWIRGHTKKGGDFINDLVADVVRKLEEYPSEPASTIKNDAVTKVIGPERRGWVRGMGFGAKPSKVDAEIEKGGTVRQLQNIVKNLEQKVEELTYIVTHGVRPTESQRSNDENTTHTHKSTPPSQVSVGEQGSAPPKKATPPSQDSVGVQGRVPPKKATCKLLHWFGTPVEVAKGEIADTSPDSVVHHVPLGEGCWKVWVHVVLKDVPLFRPNSEFVTLEHALGSTTAWPIQSIVLDS